MKAYTEIPETKKEKTFIEMFEGLAIKYLENYPYSVLYYDGEEFMIEVKKSTIWMSQKNIWNVFENDFGMSESETKEFLGEMIKIYFPCWAGLTPKKSVDSAYKWMNFINQNNI